MKLTALILSLYILGLAFAPALEMIDLSVEVQCCERSCTPVDIPDQPEEPEGCCDDICNPFISCKCCMGFTSPIVDNASGIAPCLKYKVSPNQKIPSPPVIFSIWHPPQIA